jgi:hypothetical protein
MTLFAEDRVHPFLEGEIKVESRVSCGEAEENMKASLARGEIAGKHDRR